MKTIQMQCDAIEPSSEKVINILQLFEFLNIVNDIGIGQLYFALPNSMIISL